MNSFNSNWHTVSNPIFENRVGDFCDNWWQVAAIFKSCRMYIVVVGGSIQRLDGRESVGNLHRFHQLCRTLWFLLLSQYIAMSSNPSEGNCWDSFFGIYFCKTIVKHLYHSLSLWFYRPPPSPPHLILFLSFLPPLVALSPLKPSPHPILLLLPPTLSPPSPLTQLLLHLAKVKLLLLLLVPHQTRGFCHLVTLFPPSNLLSLLFGLF